MLLRAVAVSIVLLVPRPAVAAGFAAVVTMTDTLTYQPKRVTIKAGNTVEWKNTSAVEHTVTFDAARVVHKGYVRRPGGVAPFDSGTLAPGQTFTHAFTVPGTYRYVCVMHEGSAMTGEVVVKANTR
jgi:plastocyanin